MCIRDRAIAALLAQRDRWGEGYRDAVDLYRVASGQNAKKLSFERYVLSAYFDQVVRAANRRFAGMTEGKYTLLRRTEREKGNRASGLDLEVLDSLTGKTRHVNTCLLYTSGEHPAAGDAAQPVGTAQRAGIEVKAGPVRHRKAGVVVPAEDHLSGQMAKGGAAVPGGGGRAGTCLLYTSTPNPPRWTGRAASAWTTGR